jgi:hypothetical protein
LAISRLLPVDHLASCRSFITARRLSSLVRRTPCVASLIVAAMLPRNRTVPSAYSGDDPTALSLSGKELLRDVYRDLPVVSARSAAKCESCGWVFPEKFEANWLHYQAAGSSEGSE